jgi:hypothetical protein
MESLPGKQQQGLSADDFQKRGLINMRLTRIDDNTAMGEWQGGLKSDKIEITPFEVGHALGLSFTTF